MEFYTDSGREIILTPGEVKIYKALKQLEILWKKHGTRLMLYNGNSLRVTDSKEGPFLENEIETFSIIGEGGDGGDYFKDI